MSSAPDEGETAGAAGNKLPTRARMYGAALALGGMIVGSLVGIAVQAGVESIGLLGPSVETLIAEQESNFDDMSARIEALKGMTSDSGMAASLDELGKLLSRQGELQHQSNSELSYLGQQVESLRQQSLEDRGFAGGADVWLDTGESVSVGDSNHVLGVVRKFNNAVDVKLNGQKKRLTVGDSVAVEGTACNVLVKQAQRREDGRVGFDVTCG
jgi:hypothetical protein